MGADLYKLDKKAGSRKLITSHEGTVLTISGRVKLVQQANLQYNQRTEARFEVGSDEIYWACGQSQGTLTANKLVGAQAAVWENMEPGFGAGRGNAKQKFTLTTSNGSVTGDGVFQQVTLSANVGDMTVSDNAVMAVGWVKEQ
jgi:hypothetical protein